VGYVLFDSKENRMKAGSGGLSPCLHWSPKHLDLTQLFSLAREDPPDILEMGDSLPPRCESVPHSAQAVGSPGSLR